MPNVIENSVIFLLEYAHVLYNKILTLGGKQINHPSFRFKEVCFQLTPNSIKKLLLAMGLVDLDSYVNIILEFFHFLKRILSFYGHVESITKCV